MNKLLTPARRALLLLVSLFAAVSLPTAGASSDRADEAFDPVPLVRESEQAYEKVKDYTTVLLKRERIDGKLGELETIEVKFRKPDDCYMKWISPHKGQELLYRKGFNQDRIKAHKGGVLNIINVDIEPEGKLAMNGQHHRIQDAGIGATMALVNRGMLRGIERGEAKFINHGIVKQDGHNLLKIETIYPAQCEGITHTVAKGETLWTIADRYKQDMYVILSNNKGISSPTDILEGQKILVPYHYCHRAITYGDTDLKLLVRLEIYDWNNELYEYYEYKNLKVNVGLTDADFDPDNPAYGF